MTKDSVCTFLVFERHVIKNDVAFDVAHLNGAFLVLDIRLYVHDLHEPLKARISVLELLGEINDDPYRFGERVDVENERDEIRDLHKAVRYQDSARNDDHDVYQENKCGHAGLKQAEVKIAVLLRSQKSIVAFPELLHLDVFVSKRLYDSYSGKIVFSSGVDLGYLLPVCLKCFPHLFVEKENKQEHERKQYERSRCQVSADAHQDYESTDYLDE